MERSTEKNSTSLMEETNTTSQSGWMGGDSVINPKTRKAGKNKAFLPRLDLRRKSSPKHNSQKESLLSSKKKSEGTILMARGLEQTSNQERSNRIKGDRGREIVN